MHIYIYIYIYVFSLRFYLSPKFVTPINAFTSITTRDTLLEFTIEFATVTQHGDRSMNQDLRPKYQPFITQTAHERLYHITWVYVPYSLRKTVWVLLVSK